MDYECIKRGDLFLADLGKTIGSEQGGKRPVLILQNNRGNLFSPTVIVAPLTSRPKKIDLPTHVWISKRFGLVSDSIALLEQVKTIDKDRLIEFLGFVDESTMRSIEKAVQISLGLRDIGHSHRDELELTLCSRCAGTYYGMDDRNICRTDYGQIIKEPCDICQTGRGYSYRVWPKNKDKGGTQNV